MAAGSIRNGGDKNGERAALLSQSTKGTRDRKTKAIKSIRGKGNASVLSYQNSLVSNQGSEDDDSVYLGGIPRRRRRALTVYLALLVLGVVAVSVFSLSRPSSAGYFTTDPESVNDSSFGSWKDNLAWLDVTAHIRQHWHHKRRVKRALKDLNAGMNGYVEFVEDNGSDEPSWKGWNELSNVYPPYAVVHATTASDVALAIPLLKQFEDQYDVTWSIMAGGHNYNGWSSAPDGIVLSVKSINPFTLETDPNDESFAIATMGPGTTIGDILSTGLIKQGYGGVVGSSAAVAMGGWMLGGGLGYWSRRYGMGIDNLLSAEIVLADGTIMTTSGDDDLFWALRGAGQANFGVVTQFQYKLYPAIDEMLTLSGSVPQDLAADLMMTIGQQESTSIPSSVFLSLSNDENGMILTGMALGDSPSVLDETQTALTTFLDENLPKDVADGFTFTRTSWYDSAIEELELEGFLVQNWSAFLMRNNNTRTNWNDLVDAFASMMDKGDGYVLLDVELWGGEISKVDSDFTAFPWRDGIFQVDVLVLVPATTKHAMKVFTQQVEMVDKIWRKHVEPIVKGTYANYPTKSYEEDPYEYAQRAWGRNLGRLQSIKETYDPDGIFHSALSIPAKPKKKHHGHDSE